MTRSEFRRVFDQVESNVFESRSDFEQPNHIQACDSWTGLNYTICVGDFEEGYDVWKSTIKSCLFVSVHSIIEVITNSPPGFIKSSVALYAQQEYYVNVTWTPTSSKIETKLFCFTGLEDSGYEFREML